MVFQIGLKFPSNLLHGFAEKSSRESFFLDQLFVVYEVDSMRTARKWFDLNRGAMNDPLSSDQRYFD